MRFDYSEEQVMMQDSLRRVLSAPNLACDTLWDQMVGLGATMAGISEEAGGIGGGPIELALIAEELGREGLPLSWAGVAAALGCLRAVPDGAEHLGQMADGLQYGFAWAESPHDRPDVAPALRAVTGADGQIEVTGRKFALVGGDKAEVILCTVTLNGELSLLAVPAKTMGVTLHGYQSTSRQPLADLSFDAARLPQDAVLAAGGAAREAAISGFDLGTLTACAEIVGAMRKGFELTAAYLAERQQFGRPLAHFQALQHRLVDLLIASEEARSLLHYGLSAIDGPDRARAVSSCKLRLSETATDILGDAVHLHGGMGITSEYTIGHLFAKALAFPHLWGTSEFHLDRLMASD